MKQDSRWSVAEYKDRFTELLREVERGRRHVITRHGRPVARVTPAAGERSVSETVASIRAHRVEGRRDLRGLLQKGRP